VVHSVFSKLDDYQNPKKPGYVCDSCLLFSIFEAVGDGQKTEVKML
jgi:hypothetical protein